MKTILVLSALLFVSSIAQSQTEKDQTITAIKAELKVDSINHAFHDRMQAFLRQIEPDSNGNKVFHAKMINRKTKEITIVGPAIIYKPSGKNDGVFIPATAADEYNESQYQKAGG